MKIAMQLYSIRDYTKTREDLEASLEKLAACGYKYVETAGFYGMTAAELKDLLAKYGLSGIAIMQMSAFITRLNKKQMDFFHESLQKY